MVTTRRLVGLVVHGSSTAWRRAGFSVAPGGDLEVGGVTISIVRNADEDAITGWRFAPPWPHEVHGLHPAPARPHAASPPMSEHPNGAVALDHVVVTTSDLERTTGALAEAGLTPRRSISGLRGDGEVTFRFFLLGTCVLELVGPTVADGSGPARFAGLAFTTDAIDDLGPIAAPPRPAIQPGRRITTLDPRVGVGVPIAFLSPRPNADRPAP